MPNGRLSATIGGTGQTPGKTDGREAAAIDCEKTGGIIARLRKERGLTQRQLAERLQVTDKAVSKWERGLGCPDVSLLDRLAAELGADLGALLRGGLPSQEKPGGTMKQAKYYVCPVCGEVTVATGGAEVSCCGRKLTALTAQKAGEEERLSVERVEDEWFLTSAHPMTKEHHIAFVAFAAGERLQLIRQYPEWDLQVRIPARGHGMLLWYCTRHGLFYQLL